MHPFIVIFGRQTWVGHLLAHISAFALLGDQALTLQQVKDELTAAIVSRISLHQFPAPSHLSISTFNPAQ